MHCRWYYEWIRHGKSRGSVRSRRMIIDEKYREVPQKLVEDDPDIKPNKGVDLFIKHYNLKDLGELGDGWTIVSQLN